MARTKGAKDRTKRKKPAPPAKRPTAPATPPAVKSASPVALTGQPPVSTSAPAESPRANDEFFRRIDAAIAAEPPANESPSDQPGRATGLPETGGLPAPATFDPSSLTLEGLQNAWQAPFFALAALLRLLGIAPDPQPIIAVGKRRAEELAQASYPIWDYYSRQYLNVHPDQAVNAAIGVTILDGVGIIPDLIQAVIESRRRRVTTPPPQPPSAPQGPA